jgi:hypothetical protein
MQQTSGSVIGAVAVLCPFAAPAQTVRDFRGAAPVVPLACEPAPRIIIDPPLAESLTESLTRRLVFVQYRV